MDRATFRVAWYRFRVTLRRRLGGYLAIVLLVVGVTLVGESLNDVLNPLLRTTKLNQVVLPARTPAAEATG